MAEIRPAQTRPAQTRPTPRQPAQRQLVVWRGDGVPVQHDIPGPGDLRDDTKAGRLLIGSLIRAQLGLSLLCLMIALTVTVSFPLVVALVPAVGRMRVAGLPVTLIVLGFAFYPVFLTVGCSTTVRPASSRPGSPTWSTRSAASPVTEPDG